MFESARLTDDHTLEGFDCGKESLNTWLIAHARRADSSGVAHVYVWTPLGEQKVSAYFAICPTEVVSGSMAGGYSRIPGYLIARLAIDTSLRGQGYGGQLLLDALGKAVATGCRLWPQPDPCPFSTSPAREPPWQSGLYPRLQTATNRALLPSSAHVQFSKITRLDPACAVCATAAHTTSDTH
jgi:GNAT superfamily N-acetyltransferase